MIMIRSEHYCSPFPGTSEDRLLDLSNVEPVVISDEVFQPTLAWRTVTQFTSFGQGPLTIWRKRREVKSETGFFGREMTFSLQD